MLSAPGVWPTSPMFTLCHEERSKMRGGRFAAAAARSGRESAAVAAAAAEAERKWRRFMSVGSCPAEKLPSDEILSATKATKFFAFFRPHFRPRITRIFTDQNFPIRVHP
jgi:hypothetical protein